MARPALFCAPVLVGLAVLALVVSAEGQSVPERLVPISVPPGVADTIQDDAARRAATPSGQRVATPEAPQTVTIDWNRAVADWRLQVRRLAAAGTRAAAVQDLPIPELRNATLQDAAGTRLPVLLPTVAALDMGPSPPTMLFPHENFYTASMSGNGLLVEVFGTRLVHAPAPATMRTAPRMLAADPDNFLASRGEGGWEINFSRYGAAYTVTLECDDPRDRRCATDERAREVARSLLIVGGSPDEGDVR